MGGADTTLGGATGLGQSQTSTSPIVLVGVIGWYFEYYRNNFAR